MENPIDKETRPQHKQQINFEVISNKLISKIMRKLPIREGVRARQTCKLINDLVGKEEIVFAPDDYFSFYLKITIQETADKCEFSINYETPFHSRSIEEFNLETPDVSLACVFFDSIQLIGKWHSRSFYNEVNMNEWSDKDDSNCDSSDDFSHASHLSENVSSEYNASEDYDTWLQEIGDSVFSVFNKLRLKCSLLETRHISYSDISRFLSSISCLRIHDETAQPMYPTIDAISQSNCLDLSIFVYEMPIEGIRLLRIRHLEHLELRGKYPDWRLQFARFLQELRHFHSGNLKTFTIDFSPENNTSNKFPTNFWAGCRFIWKGILPTCDYTTFPCIVQFSLMETSFKTLLIATNNRYCGSNQQFEINFLEKGDIEEMIYVVFMKQFNRKPIDTSPIYEELKGTDHNMYPSVLRMYLQIIYNYPFYWMYCND